MRKHVCSVQKGDLRRIFAGEEARQDEQTDLRWGIICAGATVADVGEDLESLM